MTEHDNVTIIDGEVTEEQPTALVPLTDQPPTVLPGIVQDELVPFPGPMIPIIIDSKSRQEAILHAKSHAGFFLLLNRANPTDDPAVGKTRPPVFDPVATAAGFGMGLGPEADIINGDEDLPEMDIGDPVGPLGEKAESTEVVDEPLGELGDVSPVGILARVMKVLRLPDGRMSALVHLLRRAQPLALIRNKPFPVFRVAYPSEIVSDEETFEAAYRQVRLTLQAFFEDHPSVPDEVKITALAIESPGILADFVAQHLSRDFKERLSFLVELDLGRRMRLALEVAIREFDMLTVGNRISQEIREKVEKHQREYLLREQLKAIRVELGEERDPTALAIEELKQKLDDAGLPEKARERADEELNRLQFLPAEAPEHNVIRSYLEWIAALPWSKVSEDNTDIVYARRVLDEDHYGLEEVKDRIIEYLAVRQLNPDNRGSLLCFAGPPGVGKTSLGKSIARALGREFYRFSVGGMRDEAEIKGHRRTYIGAMPGRILQALKQVQTSNAVLMLDELDKMGSDWRGDPSSAMLEVLDPAQNENFMDHYLDLPFDLSKVMFIATANVKSQIPGPLLDRLEVIDLPGYIPEEKLEIAQRYLFKRQRKEHGLAAKQISVGKGALRRVITDYTREAGVRELDRQIGKLCRKRATQVVRQDEVKASIAATELESYLGPPKLRDDRLRTANKPGVATGLAWTPVGGAVLFIEAARMRGKGAVKVTGQLGDVMTESTGIALSHVKHR
ncbi:MAG: endopeptidase La, partial [Myxococcota bacterium]|nr:endopeptidase La [Myxococcota bacterium]